MQTIEYLPLAPDRIKLVVAADKLHNVKCMLHDQEVYGDSLWDRFKRGREDYDWYYRALVKSLANYYFFEHPLYIEFESAVGKMFDEEKAIPPRKKGSFVVLVDDNFNFMNEDERYSSGTFDTYEEAEEKAKLIVDEFLSHYYKNGTTADELYECWAHNGDSPFISGDVGKEHVEEVLALSRTINKSMSDPKLEGENAFSERCKPAGLPPLKMFFSASIYAQQRCEEICNGKDDCPAESGAVTLPPESLPKAIRDDSAILAALLRIANEGSLKRYNMDLASLEKISNLTLDFKSAMSLALMGAESPEDVDFVNKFASACADSR